MQDLTPVCGLCDPGLRTGLILACQSLIELKPTRAARRRGPDAGRRRAGLRPEFDTFRAHFWVTPSNGAGFRAADRQTPRYMDC